jgi:hypothetical protein
MLISGSKTVIIPPDFRKAEYLNTENNNFSSDLVVIGVKLGLRL